MVVQVEQIREAGLSLAESLSQPFLAQALADAAEDGFRPDAPSVLHAQLRRTSSGVLLEGSAELPLVAPCKRCLAEVHLSVPVRFTLNLVPAEETDDRGAEAVAEETDADSSGSFELVEADQDTYRGKTIDLEPIVREQVLLALPMQVVCREDCRGLCGMCGQNLNEAACQCESKRVDPRLAVLKDIKLN
ncbi:MAG TPA: DUF177 domain-containing protein [Myxococcaceae bacterium]|nr:DUF177 domain-containing protein [Myxococcaceae bacterium]